MAIWVTLLLWAGSFAVSRIFKPKLMHSQQNAEPEAFQGITVEDGRPIPVLWGTRQIKNLNIGWNGDLSQTAIVEGASTIGYKYYLGGHYPMCMGPLDAVEELRWNEKAVGAGISASNNQLVVGIGPPPYYTATIAPGNYPTGAALAVAVEAAMKAAQDGKWKVTFGFIIAAGRNDEIAFFVKHGGTTYKRKATIVATTYATGAALAGAIAYAMDNATGPWPSDLGPFVVAYGLPFAANTFGIDYDTTEVSNYNDWGIYGDGGDASFNYLKSAKSTLGYRMNLTQTDSGNGSIAGEAAVLVNRFVFAFVGTNGALKLTDAAFTAAAFLGLSTAADVTLLHKTSDSDFAVIEATYTLTTDYIQVDINDLDFFGTEGGVSGRIDVYFGKLTQAASAYLTTKFGTTAPNWPGVSHLVQRGMYVGNTNFPKPISVTPRRCPNQLGLTGERHNIEGDANPAAMIYEILTDQRWGLKKSAAEIDVVSLLEVGETLAEEGLGLSMLLDAVGPARDVIDEILRHVNGVRVDDPVTGLFKIKLIRNDYDPAGIPVVHRDNCHACTIRRRSWDDTKNVVRVRYVDRAADYQERIAEAQNLSNIQSRDGEIAIEEVSFPGISSRAMAEITAKRILRAASLPIAAFELDVNRELWQLRTGDPFLLTWEPLGITGLPCRVTRIRTGRLEDGRIGIDAVEDLDGPAWTGFSAISAPANDAAEPLDIIPGAEASDSVLVGGVPMPEA